MGRATSEVTPALLARLKADFADQISIIGEPSVIQEAFETSPKILLINFDTPLLPDGGNGVVEIFIIGGKMKMKTWADT